MRQRLEVVRPHLALHGVDDVFLLAPPDRGALVRHVRDPQHVLIELGLHGAHLLV